jgi:hypothetical protein
VIPGAEGSEQDLLLSSVSLRVEDAVVRVTHYHPRDG